MMTRNEERQPTVDGEEWSRQTVRTTESWYGKPHKVGDEDEIYPEKRSLYNGRLMADSLRDRIL